MEDLIARLNNWTETPEDTPEENTEIFVDPSAISEEIKNQFTTYLENLLFNYFKKVGESKIPPVLNRIRNEIGEEFKEIEKNLKESKNRGEFETARFKIIRTICEKVLTTGGSDEDLKARVKAINNNFFQWIAGSNGELDKEGIKYNELPSEDKFGFKNRTNSEKPYFAKEIIEWELEILKKYANDYVTWQKTAITEVKNYWDNTLTGLIRKSAKIKEVIGENWEAGFNTKTTEDEIKVEKERLTGLIDIFKDSEIKVQNLAISKYNALLNSINKETNLNNDDYTLLINNLDWVRLTGSQTKNALLNAWNDRKNYLAKQNAKIAYDNLAEKIKKETNPNVNYTLLINNLDWTHLTSPQTKDNLIDSWNDRKNYLANKAKQDAEIAYDNLLNQIKTESNQNADYTQRINNLNWVHLDNPRTKTALTEAWTARKNDLAEMARREQERQEEQARQRQQQQEQDEQQKQTEREQEEKKQKDQEEQERQEKEQRDRKSVV